MWKMNYVVFTLTGRHSSNERGSILHNVKKIPRALHEGHVDPYGIRYVSTLPRIHAPSIYIPSSPTPAWIHGDPRQNNPRSLHGGAWIYIGSYMDPFHVPSVSDPFWHYLPPPVLSQYTFLMPAMGVYMIGAKGGGMQVRSTRRAFGFVKFRHCAGDLEWNARRSCLDFIPSAANALPSNSDGRGHVGDERVQKIERAVADVLL
uniref:Uncharacterized protein n=1 Tax=Caenorhabditis japonica TaxID=281687 RepID=A0A8R1I9W0_CAEJA